MLSYILKTTYVDVMQILRKNYKVSQNLQTTHMKFLSIEIIMTSREPLHQKLLEALLAIWTWELNSYNMYVLKFKMDIMTSSKKCVGFIKEHKFLFQKRVESWNINQRTDLSILTVTDNALNEIYHDTSMTVSTSVARCLQNFVLYLVGPMESILCDP